MFISFLKTQSRRDAKIIFIEHGMSKKTEILAVSDPALKEKLLADRKAGAEKVVAKDAALQARLSGAE